MAFLVIVVQESTAQKIGLLMDSYFVDRWYTDQKILSETIKALGGECITEDPHGDAEEQIRLGKKLIGEKVDALIIIATDAGKAIEIVDAASAAGCAGTSRR